MQTVQDIYVSTIRSLPPDERLRLAALILNDLTQPSAQAIDFEDEWTDEDLRDATVYFMKRAEEMYPYADDLV